MRANNQNMQLINNGFIGERFCYKGVKMVI